MITLNVKYRQRAFDKIFLIQLKNTTPFKRPILCGFMTVAFTISLFYGLLSEKHYKVSKINTLRTLHTVIHNLIILFFKPYLHIMRFYFKYLNITLIKKRIPVSAKRFSQFSFLFKKNYNSFFSLQTKMLPISQ